MLRLSVHTQITKSIFKSKYSTDNQYYVIINNNKIINYYFHKILSLLNRIYLFFKHNISAYQGLSGSTLVITRVAKLWMKTSVWY